MNLRGVLGSILPPLANKRSSEADRIKYDATKDRDANGQQAYSSPQQQRPPMTDEELEAAIKHLKELPSVKEHNLQISVSEQNEKKVILIHTPDGKLFRRILENELWSLIQTTDKDKGQLLSKTA